MWYSCLLLTLVAASLGSAQQKDVEGRLADLDFVATQVPRLDPYFFVRLDRTEFQAAVNRLAGGVGTLSNPEFYVGLAHLLAMAGDTHTSLYLTDTTAAAFGFQVFPLQFRWLDDGVFVTAAAPVYSRALGSRLVAAGGVPIDEVLQRLATVISHESEEGLHSSAQRYLRGQQILQALQIVPPGATSELTFRTAGGDEFTLTAGVEAASMTGAPDPKLGPIPDYLALPNSFYWGRYWPANRVLYFKYNMCQNAGTPFTVFAANLLAVLDGNPVDAFVFDFRGNPGGDSSVIQPLMDGLRRRMATLLANPNFRIYAAFDKNTFSSANLNAMYLKAPDFDTGGIVRFIGEPTGEPPGGYGNIVRFVLPSSGMTGQYPTKPFPPPAWIAAGALLAPDIAIHTRSTDYFARFDPVMAAILARSAGPVEAPSGDVIAVNGASFQPDLGIAPGSFAAAFGVFGAVPDEVLVSGVPSRVVAAGASQVNFVTPAPVAPGRVTISVRAAGRELASGQATITETGPGIFVLPSADASQPGAVENEDFSINSKENPAAKGSVIQIFGTGNGVGSAAVQVFAGVNPAQVLYSGTAAPGLWQLNVRLPDSVTEQTPLFVIAGNAASNGVTIWVQ
jgi:uncharacterized protein (TIGR03437 family)